MQKGLQVYTRSSRKDVIYRNVQNCLGISRRIQKDQDRSGKHLERCTKNYLEKSMIMQKDLERNILIYYKHQNKGVKSCREILKDWKQFMNIQKASTNDLGSFIKP